MRSVVQFFLLQKVEDRSVTHIFIVINNIIVIVTTLSPEYIHQCVQAFFCVLNAQQTISTEKLSKKYFSSDNSTEW